jgi:hypothetical protein
VAYRRGAEGLAGIELTNAVINLSQTPDRRKAAYLAMNEEWVDFLRKNQYILQNKSRDIHKSLADILRRQGINI